METQIRLSHHNKFISAENITIFSVSSDDYLHASSLVTENQMWSYSSYSEDKIKELKNFLIVLTPNILTPSAHAYEWNNL